jgi:hypothetical protein
MEKSFTLIQNAATKYPITGPMGEAFNCWPTTAIKILVGNMNLNPGKTFSDSLRSNECAIYSLNSDGACTFQRRFGTLERPFKEDFWPEYNWTNALIGADALGALQLRRRNPWENNANGYYSRIRPQYLAKELVPCGGVVMPPQLAWLCSPPKDGNPPSMVLPTIMVQEITRRRLDGLLMEFHKAPLYSREHIAQTNLIMTKWNTLVSLIDWQKISDEALATYSFQFLEKLDEAGVPEEHALGLVNSFELFRKEADRKIPVHIVPGKFGDPAPEEAKDWVCPVVRGTSIFVSDKASPFIEEGGLFKRELKSEDFASYFGQ